MTDASLRRRFDEDDQMRMALALSESTRPGAVPQNNSAELEDEQLRAAAAASQEAYRAERSHM